MGLVGQERGVGALLARVDRCGRRGGALEQHDGQVVRQTAARNVVVHRVEHGVERILDRFSGQQWHEAAQVQELAPRVARLAEAVGVHQQPVTRSPGHGDCVVHLAQTERQPRGRVQEQRAAIGPDQHGRRVATADERDPGGLRCVDQQCGDELLVVEERRQVLAHVAGDVRQEVLVPADWRNARITRADCSTAAMPLPRTSPTRNRHATPSVVAVVEVPADGRVLRRGLVAGREGHLTDQTRKRRQDGPLRHLGDLDDPCVSLHLTRPHDRDDDRDNTDEEHVDDPDQVLRGAPGVIPPAGGDGRGHSCCGGRCRGSCGEHDAGDQRRQREQRGEHHRSAGNGQVCGDQDNQPEGDETGVENLRGSVSARGHERPPGRRVPKSYGQRYAPGDDLAGAQVRLVQAHATGRAGRTGRGCRSYSPVA